MTDVIVSNSKATDRTSASVLMQDATEGTLEQKPRMRRHLHDI